MNGWFAVKHGITKHPIFDGKPLRLAAWIWILDNAAWADTQQDVGGELVVIKRGELCASQATMESGTGMSRQQLRTFLDVLRREGVVRTRNAKKSTKGRTIITVCNYSKYQDHQPSSNQAATKQQPIKEQDNNIPVGTKQTSSLDLGAVIFGDGLRYLVSSGMSEPSARAFLGKMRKRSTDGDLIEAISRAQRENAIDPKPFIVGCLNFKEAGPRLANGMTHDEWLQEALT